MLYDHGGLNMYKKNCFEIHQNPCIYSNISTVFRCIRRKETS
jgi:hypothetical protein